MEGFDKPGQLGAGCQPQHIPAAAGAVLPARSLPALFREVWLLCRHPGGSRKLGSSHCVAFSLCLGAGQSWARQQAGCDLIQHHQLRWDP